MRPATRDNTVPYHNTERAGSGYSTDGWNGPNGSRRLAGSSPRAASSAYASRSWPNGLGVTKGGFYRRFKDRRALLDALLETWSAGRIAAHPATNGARRPDAARTAEGR